MEKHTSTVGLRRAAMLDLLEGRGECSLRDASAVLVQPLVAKLSDEDGGPEFLRVAAQLADRAVRQIDPGEPAGALVHDRSKSLERWGRLVEPMMPPGTAGAPLHRRFAAIRFTHLELGRRAHAAEASALFASHLTDLVTALLSAELSPETQRLLRARAGRSTRRSSR